MHPGQEWSTEVVYKPVGLFLCCQVQWKPTSFHKLHLIHQLQGFPDQEMQLISNPNKNNNKTTLATTLKLKFQQANVILPLYDRAHKMHSKTNWRTNSTKQSLKLNHFTSGSPLGKYGKMNGSRGWLTN